MKNIRTNMSISMPQKLKNFVKTRTEKEFYGTPSDYIRALIRKELQKKEEQERLEKNLLAGLKSKSEKMTPNKRKTFKSQVLKDIQK